MEMYETKRFIPKGFELGTTLSKPIRSILLLLSVFLKTFFKMLSWYANERHGGPKKINGSRRSQVLSYNLSPPSFSAY